VTDTPPHVQRLYHDLLMSRSPQERFMMGASMRAAAREIVLASIGERDDWREQLFLRYYKRDFTPQQREKILARLRELRGPRS
jgi:hypothetical protein